MMRLRECREKANLSQKYVAISLGIAAPSVANWERDKTKPSLDNAIQLADLYEVSLDYLLGRSDHRDGALSDDELVLLERYRALGDEDKELLRSDALRMKRKGERPTRWSNRQDNLFSLDLYRRKR